jgi:RNA polymerase sigma factor (sigma-70 family)
MLHSPKGEINSNKSTVVSRVDYSELVEAIQKGEDSKANKLLEELVPRIEEYLIVALQADRNEAQEVVQEVFTEVYDRIRKDKIYDHKFIFRYILSAAKNEFVRYKKYQHRFKGPDDLDEMTHPAEQFKRLLDKERMQILEDCLYELDRESRELIRYMLKNPDKSSKEYASYFEISSGNVRIRKSRILNTLHHCYKRKSTR